MIYKRIKPQLALQSFVEEYMFFSMTKEESSGRLVTVLPPLPEHGIEFLPKGLATVVDKQTGEIHVESRVVLFGYPVFRKDFIMPSDAYVVIRVIMTPGSLFKLLGGLAVGAFTNKVVNADDVIGNELENVNEQIGDATDYLKMIEVVERYLLLKLCARRNSFHAIDEVAQVLERRPEHFSLDWLACQACLSPRQFNRIFTERMGIGPKLFSRISRFNKAMAYKERNPSADWSSIAYNLGYTDYQHLYKDFKQFAGVSPPALLLEGFFNPHRILPNSL